MRARWVTGYYGHGGAFLIDLALLLRMWVAWRTRRTADAQAEG